MKSKFVLSLIGIIVILFFFLFYQSCKYRSVLLAEIKTMEKDFSNKQKLYEFDKKKNDDIVKSLRLAIDEKKSENNTLDQKLKEIATRANLIKIKASKDINYKTVSINELKNEIIGRDEIIGKQQEIIEIQAVKIINLTMIAENSEQQWKLALSREVMLQDLLEKSESIKKKIEKLPKRRKLFSVGPGVGIRTDGTIAFSVSIHVPIFGM